MDHLRRQKPGVLSVLYNPQGRPTRNNVVDPDHPALAALATSSKSRILPSWRHEACGITLAPYSLLGLPQNPAEYPFKTPFVPWSQRVEDLVLAGYTAVKAKPGRASEKAKRPHATEERYVILDPSGKPLPPTSQVRVGRLFDDRAAQSIPPLRLSAHAHSNSGVSSNHKVSRIRTWTLRKLERRLPMSIAISTSIARQGKPRYVRRAEDVKLRTALNWLIVNGARAAPVADSTTTNNLLFKYPPPSFLRQASPGLPSSITYSDPHDPHAWVMQGWTYIFYPNIQLYRMPYYDVIALLSEGLQELNRRAAILEYNWLSKSLFTSRSTPSLLPPPHPAEGTRHIDAPMEALRQTPPPSSTSYLKKQVESKHIYQFPRKTMVDPGDEWRKEMLTGIQLLRQSLADPESAHGPTKPASTST